MQKKLVYENYLFPPLAQRYFCWSITFLSFFRRTMFTTNKKLNPELCQDHHPHTTYQELLSHFKHSRKLILLIWKIIKPNHTILPQRLSGGIKSKIWKNLGKIPKVGGLVEKNSKKSKFLFENFQKPSGGSWFFKNVWIMKYSQTPSYKIKIKKLNMPIFNENMPK